MKLQPVDPDVETLISRIGAGDIDLQPDFQRGEVWSLTMKQRLIDSIMREWHVPPIHLLQPTSGARELVLDGQQRLAAIRDFHADLFALNGTLQPQDARLRELDGLHFSQLPSEWRRRFLRFTLRVIRVFDYSPEEPGELFFRLNQLARLTTAEQRNAFFGPAREQIRSLAERMSRIGLDENYIGFSNSRMAHDDVLARVSLSFEFGSLFTKIRAESLGLKYRNSEGFSQSALDKAACSVDLLARLKPHTGGPFAFNKATLYSWLIFLAQLPHINAADGWLEVLGNFMRQFEDERRSLSRAIEDDPNEFRDRRLRTVLLMIYNDRSTSRVADVASVVLRDFIVWTMWLAHAPVPASSRAGALAAEFAERLGRRVDVDEEELVASLASAGWGRLE